MLLLNTICLLTALLVSSVKGQDGYAASNGGTTGGAGGTTTTVSAAAAFQTAIKAGFQSDTPKTVFLKGPITLSSQAQVGNNTSILGVGTTAVINGGGLSIKGKSNIIVRNLLINKVVGNDGITIQQRAHNIWIDHNEFYSDLDHGFDFYDGQVDITHASDYVTVSYNYFHDHFKSSLVGGDPNGGSEVSTYGFVIPDDSPANPTGDFEPDGFANLGAANNFGSGKNNITATGNFTSVPYSYTLTPLANVQALVLSQAGVGKI
ncbi:hypothetical protein V5O48_007684 [Marasmius crinis-equi]|uniref:Pectate lyase domain-containing protein n=1 Tax=Marasmius crinis-equi TaxID=585013 RepID=A0ABR3FG79_9AGAR